MPCLHPPQGHHAIALAVAQQRNPVHGGEALDRVAAFLAVAQQRNPVHGGGALGGVPFLRLTSSLASYLPAGNQIPRHPRFPSGSSPPAAVTHLAHLPSTLLPTKPSTGSSPPGQAGRGRVCGAERSRVPQVRKGRGGEGERRVTWYKWMEGDTEWPLVCIFHPPFRLAPLNVQYGVHVFNCAKAGSISPLSSQPLSLPPLLQWLQYGVQLRRGGQLCNARLVGCWQGGCAVQLPQRWRPHQHAHL